MFKPRVIPALLLKNTGLVKTTKFKNPRYIGDPINAVKIFNDMEADELVFLDILASKMNRCISIDFVRKVGDEANMPFSAGGGIKSVDQIKNILNAGAEKVVINSHALADKTLISKASNDYGSSTIVVCVDVKKSYFGRYHIYTKCGTKRTKMDIVDYIQEVEKQGAGELIINCIDRDGTMEGYDIELMKRVSESVGIPVVALGGSGNIKHMSDVLDQTYVSAVAAGSQFVYHGNRNAVLINYPSQKELKIFERSLK
jgi:imidazole glycerol-phosphate synthase subunit HisF